MRRTVAMAILLFFWVGGLLGYAETPQEEEGLVTIETEGLYFRVPPDWPIVKRHGSLMPLPISEYLHKKLKGVNERLDAIHEKIGNLTKRLDQMEEALETHKREEEVAEWQKGK